LTNRAKSKERDEIRRRGLPVEAHPSDALRLLHDPDLLAWAADPWLNSHWHQARMTTRGRDGLSVLDAFADKDSAAKWAAQASALLKLDAVSLQAKIPALKLTEVEKKKEWDPAYDPESKRDIVVGCILRRVVSAHLAYILAITCKGRLSKAARAYIPGKIEPAPTLAKEVARLTRQGYVYYAKFDVRDAFNTIGWRPLRRALLAMGYPQQFVDVLMLFVQAPTEKRIRGRWLRQPRSRGALAGLPESGILLNILMLEIDRKILRECQVYYARYSDDLIIVARTRSDVALAAKMFLNWAWADGLQVKGVPRRSDPARWIKDIREERLELLGIEIDHQGDLHIPQSKVDGQLAKQRHFERQAIETPHLVVGRSRYASGSSRRGIRVADQDDLDQMVWGFHRYWLPLNRAEAEIFLSVASARISYGIYRKGHGPHRKLFVALLGRESAHSSLRAGDESGSPHSRPSDWIAREVLPIVEECLSFDPGARDAVHRPTGVPTLGVSEISRAGKGVVSTAPCTPALGMNDSAEYVPDVDSSCGGTSSSWGLQALGVDSLPHAGVGFDQGASADLDEVDAADVAPAAPWDHSARSSEWSQGNVANAVFSFIESRMLDDQTVIVGVQEFADDGLELQPRPPLVRLHRDVEREVASLRTLTERRVAAAEERRAFVALGPSWLPKQLLVADRSFRRVGIFGLVMTLHDAAERDGQVVLVVGPIRAPAELGVAMTSFGNEHSAGPHPPGRSRRDRIATPVLRRNAS
jgi:hypothetical protein